MPESDEEVQRQVEEVFGFKPCLWQICVIQAVLAGKDVIIVAPTGSGKSLAHSYIQILSSRSFWVKWTMYLCLTAVVVLWKVSMSTLVLYFTCITR